jgi:hypothetical protein
VEYQTNPSNLVNQEDKRMEDIGFQKRHLDLWVDAKTFGKFSLGYGSTASDDTSEMDLSGTGVVGYSSIADMAGGQLFFDNEHGHIIRYHRLTLFLQHGRAGTRGAHPLRQPLVRRIDRLGILRGRRRRGLCRALRAQMDAFKLAAAAAYANPGGSSDIIDDQLAGSVSVLHDSGFNGTFAMGTRDQKGAGVNDAGFFYTKFGYRAAGAPWG